MNYNNNNNNKPSADDIAHGIALHEMGKRLDTYAANGGQFTAEYSYLTYILHVAIAFATGAIISAFMSTVLGVICGIVSFIISLIIHCHKCETYSFENYKASYLKKIILYTVITVAIVVFIIMVKERII